VRILSRDPLRLTNRSWTDSVEITEGDVLEPQSLTKAMQDVQVCFYLIHSIASSGNFREKDIEAARNFGQAAKQTGVEQIIYLGGLGGSNDKALSKHLQSRHETGDTLRERGVPVTEFRAAIIVGSGGVSFEMVRYLTERLPVMITPKWVSTRIQPIAVEDVLQYLLAAVQNDDAKGKIIEIGGQDVLTYGEMMQGYASARGLKRWLIPVPVLTPRLSSYWVNLVTPIPASIARPLIDGLRNEVIVTDHSAQQIFPQIHPMSYHDALTQALTHIQNDDVETSWTDALSATHPGKLEKFKQADKEGMLIDQRQVVVDKDVQTVFATVLRIGGKHGWYYGDILWQLRGLADRMVGGPGLRRSRRHPDQLRPGDILDFWRVEAIEQDKMLRMRAEMLLPGRAWLEFKTEPKTQATDDEKREQSTSDHPQTILTQTAFFKSRGLAGLAYWYGIYFIHRLVFAGMIDGVKRRAEAVTQDKVKVQQEGTVPQSTAT
jgi:uncharacterized protein YbjT (DUF2867 family)